MKLFVLVAAMALCAGTAFADRIIFAPTGTVLGGGDIRAEGAISPSDDDTRFYWVGLGLQRLEISGMRVENGTGLVTTGDADLLGAELAILPETTLTPGVGVGVWDATDETTDGTGYYLALTKVLPLTGEIPSPIRDIRVHAGFGIAGIDSFFAGAEATIPFGLRVSAEYFQKDFNFAVGWGLAGLRVKGYLLDGETFYGLEFRSPL